MNKYQEIAISKMADANTTEDMMEEIFQKHCNNCAIKCHKLACSYGTCPVEEARNWIGKIFENIIPDDSLGIVRGLIKSGAFMALESMFPTT